MGDKKTLSGRLAIVEERRAAWRDRDAARFELSEALAGTEETTVPSDRGFLLHQPGAFPLADEVVAAATELLDGIGHDELVSRATKGAYLTQGLLPENLPPDSPYLRFVLDETVVAPVAEYLGMVPVLHAIDLWYSFHRADAPVRSQRWHLDSGDTTQIKVWIHCSDVGLDSGPLTVIDAATSDNIAHEIAYDFGDGHRVEDERVEELAGAAVTSLEGPAGTVHFVDTSRCFHMGSRVAATGTPRRVFVAQYLTPYAFRFRPSHLEKAPYRTLIHSGSGELERLLLGAA